MFVIRYSIEREKKETHNNKTVTDIYMFILQSNQSNIVFTPVLFSNKICIENQFRLDL